jgi:hypothetical protein
MGGGLLNIMAYGQENVLLNGNPQKTFFKATYAKYTNFGLQRFRINYEGTRSLNGNTDTVLNFKIPRYAELLHDSYFVINLPNIWSPFFFKGDEIYPYEFKWIEELGSTMIKLIEIKSAGNTIATYSGEYLSCKANRDLTKEKKDLWDEMTGNTKDLYGPENVNGNTNVYPNAHYYNNNNVEPSIRGRKLYIPLNTFFGDSSKTALPLVALQYQEIQIDITLRRLYDLYTINDVLNMNNPNEKYRIRPNPTVGDLQYWKFLQPPKDNRASRENYLVPNDGIGTLWVPDPHLISTYIFLDQEERRYFAKTEHVYLIRQIHEYDFLGKHGTNTIEMESRDIVASYMWRFRRNDCKFRNEWSNYTNWAYNNIIPQTLKYPTKMMLDVPNPNNYFITGNRGVYPYNIKNILLDLGILVGGAYRENVLDSGVFNYLEKYNRTNGNAKNGLYCYNFCLNSNRKEYQPSGGMNMNKFKTVAFEFTTIEPPINYEDVGGEFMCDNSGNPIGFRKNISDITQYSFDLKVFEERYNFIIIKSGRLGLLNAK